MWLYPRIYALQPTLAVHIANEIGGRIGIAFTDDGLARQPRHAGEEIPFTTAAVEAQTNPAADFSGIAAAALC